MEKKENDRCSDKSLYLTFVVIQYLIIRILTKQLTIEISPRNPLDPILPMKRSVPPSEISKKIALDCTSSRVSNSCRGSVRKKIKVANPETGFEVKPIFSKNETLRPIDEVPPPTISNKVIRKSFKNQASYYSL